MDVTMLTAAEEAAYEEMLRRREDTLLYVSLKYRDLLKAYLDAEDFYLIAKEGGRLLGAMPLFLKRNAECGNVLNSLPYYGSNGGMVISPDAPDPERVFRALVGGLGDVARDTDAISATLITSPFEPFRELYERHLAPRFRDYRIGQVTLLPQDKDAPEEALMDSFHKKSRNAIRKARNEGVTFSTACDEDVLRFLAGTHRENLEAIGGQAKDWRFFQTVSEVFECDADFNVYHAALDGKPIGALLLFYYNRTVEYFTPATVLEYRSVQANSLLVLEAMKDTVAQGFRYWNFGGTWRTQEGVYRFKNRLGARDMPYQYYVIDYGSMGHLLEMTASQVLAKYPSFYVLPFDQLAQ